MLLLILQVDKSLYVVWNYSTCDTKWKMDVLRGRTMPVFKYSSRFPYKSVNTLHRRGGLDSKSLNLSSFQGEMEII